ncbi:DUF998 domain-containing protein [Rhodococcus daqingensis]|uniref:DUF998 domain-containing protein n=1 Tax=Rhodococcus daqingensis TaxID=2479363 RepID=A0ABW2RWT8_9NOCA
MIPAAPRAQRRTRIATLTLLVVGAVLYSSWLLELVLPTGLDPTEAFASELAALDQPYGFVFRTGDLCTGIILTVAGVLGLTLRPRRALTTVGWAALVVFAISTAADSRMPLSCAAHASAQCAALEAAGLSESARLHAVTSWFAAVSAAVSGLAFIAAAFRYRWPRGQRVFGVVLLCAYLAGTVWLYFATGGGDVWGLGVAQRLQLAATTGWLIFVALHTSRGLREGST